MDILEIYLPKILALALIYNLSTVDFYLRTAAVIIKTEHLFSTFSAVCLLHMYAVMVYNLTTSDLLVKD